MAERQGLEVWGYRMCMKDRMRRFLVDVLDIHNKDVIEKVIGISSTRHYPKGRALYNQGEPVDTCCFLMEGVTGAFLYTTGGKQISDDFSFVSGEMITPFTNRQRKALTSVVAMSNVDVFVIANMDVITLFRTYPEFQTILFEWLMQAYHKQWALKSARYQMAAKERYLFFLKEYEGLEDVVSDRFLASFLDMSPETLSRQKRCLREEKPD
ncbi:Crp/Fnr family transcriptional regulator [Firmicutes bacterium AM29-6AC]|uniref:Cyclic nucleotide-binding domain-containing protein n=1 Tax=Anaerotignum faecicola TaxID=2358141 RepID=A0A401LBP7_9FIRM|nr:Crp/Fnr family transcriptional regulator [Anaerotignum faecicola]RHR16948.1 Crp/Fnr family transcriptional regulator [Firmicutes bacterium AF19-2LB]RHT41247.1 Crp/Fnr family transcriptional regulator [Firmicutes bacterium AM29-6AC]GCB28948.1 hypothetical protein KGMB03357_06090 [Anaerotignum faecicola]